MILELKKLSQKKNKINLTSGKDMDHCLSSENNVIIFSLATTKYIVFLKQLKMKFWHDFVKLEPDYLILFGSLAYLKSWNSGPAHLWNFLIIFRA
jgi:hypothetical protein